MLKIGLDVNMKHRVLFSYKDKSKPEFRGERCRTCPPLQAHPHKKVKEINVGISLKAHGYSHLLHINICKLSQICKKYMPKNEVFPMQNQSAKGTEMTDSMKT